MASRQLAKLDRAHKDAGLHAIAARLRAARARVFEANEQDLARGRAQGLGVALLDRLTMGPQQLEATARAVEHVASLEDPVASRGPARTLPSGLRVYRQRLPLGVIGMVYESRPNVTVDAAALCLKAGNAVLLRGGREAAATNHVLGELLREGARDAGLPEQAVQLIAPGSREEIKELVQLVGLLDLCIPRGGEGLIRFVNEHARVPVISHYKGVCHLYVDEGADVDMARALVLNGKVQRPGVCNALECLLVHAADAPRLLPPLAAALLEAGVELRGCEASRALVPALRAAAPEDYGAEYLDLVLAVKLVEDLDAALDHVERYGSGHSEVICTRDWARAQRWVREVDASCVLVNASSRFNDGGELGLGAEIGISTSKLHAYGPMGLESLTAEKWVVEGDGQVRG